MKAPVGLEHGILFFLCMQGGGQSKGFLAYLLVRKVVVVSVMLVLMLMVVVFCGRGGGGSDAAWVLCGLYT